jgi:hypothetical protein
MVLIMSNDPIVNLVNSSPSYLKALEVFSEKRNSIKLEDNRSVNRTDNTPSKSE